MVPVVLPVGLGQFVVVVGGAPTPWPTAPTFMPRFLRLGVARLVRRDPVGGDQSAVQDYEVALAAAGRTSRRPGAQAARTSTVSST